MSSRQYSFNARWGPRGDDARACGARLAAMLQRLAELHPAFARWNEKADRLEDARRPFCAMPPQIDELAAQFARHRMEPVLGRDLGFSVAAWNGRQDAYAASFHVRAGDGEELKPWLPPFSNSVSINLRRRSEENADLMNTAAMRALVLAVAAAWEPESCELQDREFYKIATTSPRKHVPPFRAGWMTYLGPRYTPHVVPPPEVIAESVPGGGLLMMATQEPYDLSNPVHASAADAIQRALAPIQSLVTP